jgi:hypothetical protein
VHKIKIENYHDWAVKEKIAATPSIGAIVGNIL